MILFLGGGGTTDPAMARAFIAAARNRPIVVLAITRVEPLENGPKSVEFMKENGARDVRFFHRTEPSEGDRRLLASYVRSGAALWVPGGDQNLAIQRLGHEWFAREIRPYVTVYGGTSAGAMLASDPMITGNGPEAGTATTGRGFGLWNRLVDTHYRERSREKRLGQAMLATGTQEGVGLSEKAWIEIRDGRIVRRVGTVDTVPQRAIRAEKSARAAKT